MATAVGNINYYAGRSAAYLAVAVAVATALLPIIADTDWESTAGILGGAVAILVVAREFISGGRKFEGRLARGTVSAEGANYYAGRIATVLGAFIGLGTALIPIIANTDWTSTAGILAGAAVAIAAIREFIVGAQAHEARLDGEIVDSGVSIPLAPVESGEVRRIPNAPR